jgi:hypothetical protein
MRFSKPSKPHMCTVLDIQQDGGISPPSILGSSRTSSFCITDKLILEWSILNTRFLGPVSALTVHEELEQRKRAARLR